MASIQEVVFKKPSDMKKEFGKKPKKMTLQDILKIRKERREGWEPERQEKYQEFCSKLKEAHHTIIDELCETIQQKSEQVLYANQDATEFKLFDPQRDITSELNGFKSITLMRGFWNPRSKRHDRIPHIEAGISSKPINEVNQRLREYGYHVKDISNRKVSNKIVISVRFTELHSEAKAVEKTTDTSTQDETTIDEVQTETSTTAVVEEQTAEAVVVEEETVEAVVAEEQTTETVVEEEMTEAEQ